MIHFDLPKKKDQIEKLEAKQLSDGFWNDRRLAAKLISNLNRLKDVVETYTSLLTSFGNLIDEVEMLKDEYSEEMHQLINDEYLKLKDSLNKFEMLILLNDEYDKANAIIEIHPGAGGTESQDWANMLYNMYVRYAERHNLHIEMFDYQAAEDAGIKSVSFMIKGNNAYGYLKSEKGVHRLVRISPFDASGRRHTSFASVDVIPQLENDAGITINEEDLRIDTYRASGAGGQHINKTDSAVRITHIPTGIVTSCQTQRSQIQNKEAAMQALKAKLLQKQIQEQQDRLNAIRGEQKSIEWGSQIRSYVFMPYLLVKDHRSDFETSDVKGVMDGDIDDIIYAYLKWEVKKNEN